MTCSGIHREFTHRVKSVSMSKFTSQEVESLQEGGNQRARETFLKDWDPREQRLPDNSNVDKVREFIKSVYVDKKFFASKASGKPPRDALNLRGHEDETRRASSYHSYSQSPPYDYQYEERRYGKQAPSLTKKPGSDRGMLRILSTSRLSDHGQEDRFANEVVVNARASDYSGTSGGDPFRSGTQSPTYHRSSLSREMSRDNLTQDVTNAPSVESGKFDGLDLFSAPNAPQTATSATSTESGKFGGLDLFSTQYVPPQSTTSTTPSVVDLFDFSSSSINTTQPPSNPVPPTAAVNQDFNVFDPSSLDLFTVVPQQQSQEKSPDVKNEGWATFDMPWHAQQPTQGNKTSTVVPETSTSEGSFGKFDQPPSMDNNTSHWAPFHQDVGIPLGAQNNQPWSPFEESKQNIYTSNQVPVQESSFVDPYLAWGISENFKMKQADVDAPPFLTTTPHAIQSFDSPSELPVHDGAQLHRQDTKSRNPFDFPSDSDLEVSDMFLDMSSLQSALPNHMSTAWFPENTAPSMQIPNIQAQGPVASIGGNPFG